MVTPIVLEVSDALVPFVDSRQDGGKFLFELIPFMRDGLFVELGVRFPGVRARGNPSLPPGAYQIQINEVPVVTGQATLGHILVNDTVDRLKLMNVQGFEAINPATRQPAAWVPGAAQGDARGGRASPPGTCRATSSCTWRRCCGATRASSSACRKCRRCSTSSRRPSPPSSRRSCPRW